MAKEKIEKSKLYKIWTIAINAVLVLLILVGLIIAVSLIPFKNNYRILAVMSGSMEPTIQTGSLIVIKPAGEYKEQDVVTFKTPGSNKKNDYTTHRIVKMESKDGRSTYITKGDANKTDDTKRVSKDEVVGKELFSIALLGYLLGYIKTLPGLIIIVIIPAVIIVYEEVNNIKAEAKNIIEKRKIKKAKNAKSTKKN